MRLVCPNCDAQYEVADSAIPVGGRDVQCSNCGHAWFQMPPAAEVAVAEEAALFGDAIAAQTAPPAPVTEAPPMPADAFPEDDLPEPPPPVTPPSRPLDDSLMSVLREEAEREMQARRNEDPRPVETQGELGIEEAAAATALTPTQRRLSMLKGKDPDAPPPPVKPAARRDLFPDVEEINSTLRPSSQVADEDDSVDRLPDLTKPSGGFRSGFMLMLILCVLVALVYVAAPRLAEQFPAMAGGLQTFVQTIDGLRLWLDAAMESAASALGGKAS